MDVDILLAGVAGVDFDSAGSGTSRCSGAELTSF
jgi:hypothetical protein